MSSAIELLEQAFNQPTVAVEIADVAPHPRNVRHGDIGAIAVSLTELGQYRPIVAQSSTSYILAGNHTWRAAKSLGWSHIGVTYIDVDDEMALRIMIVDNRTAELATNDEEALSALLAELAGSTTGLLGTGYDGDDLDELIAGLTPVDDGDERYTPAWLFEAMDVEFDIDLAAPPGGIPYIPAKRYFTKQDDALTQDWTGLFAWCNPPYSIASKFGEKWLAQIDEGIWLGPQSNAQYRLDLMRGGKVVWLSANLSFHTGDITTVPEGIRWPVQAIGWGTLAPKVCSISIGPLPTRVSVPEL